MNSRAVLPAGSPPDAPRRTRSDLWVAGALLVAAVVLRAPGLGPSSLWLDDAWVALVTRTSGVSDTMLVGLTGPGFVFLLKGVLEATGFSELAAQALPFIAAVVAVPLLYLVAMARGLSVVGALSSAGLLLVAPEHVEYATRVKQFTLDALLVVVMIAVGWAATSAPTRRRLAVVVAVAVATTAVSAGVAPAAAACLGAVGLGSIGRGRRAMAEAAAGGAIWAVFAAGWYALVLRPRIAVSLREYWQDYYVAIDAGLVAAVRDVARGLTRLLEGFSVLPPALSGLLLSVGVAVAIRRWGRAAFLLIGPALVLLAMAALELAPFGGGRTDLFLYPGLALLGGTAAEAAGRWLGRSAVPLVVVGLLLLAIAGPAPAYPQEDVRPLVAELEDRWRPDDRLLVYPSTIWAFGIYTSLPVRVVADSSNGWGFRPEVSDPRVRLLPPSRDDPDRYVSDVQMATAQRQPTWLLASHRRKDIAVIHGALRAAGFEPDLRLTRPGAALVRWMPVRSGKPAAE